MNSLIQSNKTDFPFGITNQQDFYGFCAKIQNSNLVPKSFKGNPIEIMCAALFGASKGLDFFSSLRGIAVINGTPTIWGDTALAMIQRSGLLEDMEEYFEGDLLTTIDGNGNSFYDLKGSNIVAYCKVKRNNKNSITRSFSLKEAFAAGLVQRSDCWKKYPKRMLQMRARGFALRDQFSDVLEGINLREELIEYSEDSNSNNVFIDKKNGIDALKKIIKKEPEQEKETKLFFEIKEKLENSKNRNELMEVVDIIKNSDLNEDEKDMLKDSYKTKNFLLPEENTENHSDQMN